MEYQVTVSFATKDIDSPTLIVLCTSIRSKIIPVTNGFLAKSTTLKPTSPEKD